MSSVPTTTIVLLEILTPKKEEGCSHPIHLQKKARREDGMAALYIQAAEYF